MTVDSAIPAVCHCQVLRQAARRATAFYDAALAPFGLSISQYAILSRLRRLGPMSLHALAAELALDRTTMARNLAPLERDGLVRVQPDAGDRRVRLATLAPAGLARFQQARPAWQDAQQRFEAQFGAAEADALRQDLLRMTDVLGAHPPAP